jgi:hypothetical protein
MSNYFVNSGHTIIHEGKPIHSGQDVPMFIVENWKKRKELDFYLSKGIVLKKEPVLDPEKDKKSGSRLVKNLHTPKVEPAKAKKENRENKANKANELGPVKAK